MFDLTEVEFAFVLRVANNNAAAGGLGILVVSVDLLDVVYLVWVGLSDQLGHLASLPPFSFSSLPVLVLPFHDFEGFLPFLSFLFI